MNSPMSFQSASYEAQDAQIKNKVLRSTYTLLAISLVPTAIGAWLGVAMNLGVILRGWMGLIIFMVGAYGFMFAIQRNRHSQVGVWLLLAFTFFMGVMLSGLLSAILGRYSNGSQLIMTAFAGTAGVFFAMSAIAHSIKRDISGMGKYLFVAALALMIGGIVNVFLGSSMGMLLMSCCAIVLFSLYLIYDIKQVIDGGETNYISATLGLYLNLYNIFQSLLSLLGIFGGERD